MIAIERVKMESFDLMQYFYGKIHNPLIHGSIRLRGHLDEAALAEALSHAVRTLPILGCRVELRYGRPRWSDAGFTGRDLLKTAPDTDGAWEKAMAERIDIAHEPQAKVFLLRGEEDDRLVILTNHMVCDGTGFKEFLYLISRLYSEQAAARPARRYRMENEIQPGFFAGLVSLAS